MDKDLIAISAMTIALLFVVAFAWCQSPASFI